MSAVQDVPEVTVPPPDSPCVFVCVATFLGAMYTEAHGELGGGTVIPRPHCGLLLDCRDGIQVNILSCRCISARIPLYEKVSVLSCR